MSPNQSYYQQLFQDLLSNQSQQLLQVNTSLQQQQQKHASDIQNLVTQDQLSYQGEILADQIKNLSSFYDQVAKKQHVEITKQRNQQKAELESNSKALDNKLDKTNEQTLTEIKQQLALFEQKLQQLLQQQNGSSSQKANDFQNASSCKNLITCFLSKNFKAQQLNESSSLLLQMIKEQNSQIQQVGDKLQCMQTEYTGLTESASAQNEKIFNQQQNLTLENQHQKNLLSAETKKQQNQQQVELQKQIQNNNQEYEKKLKRN